MGHFYIEKNELGFFFKDGGAGFYDIGALRKEGELGAVLCNIGAEGFAAVLLVVYYDGGYVGHIRE